MNKHEVMQWIKGHKKEVIVGSLMIVGSVVLGTSCAHFHKANGINELFSADACTNTTALDDGSIPFDASVFNIGEWTDGGYWSPSGINDAIVNNVKLSDLGNFGQMIIDKANQGFLSDDHINAIVWIHYKYPGD